MRDGGWDGIQGIAGEGDTAGRNQGHAEGGACAAPIIVAGALPLAAGAVTGIGGVRISINGNGAANVTVGYGGVFVVTGNGFQPNSVVYRSIAYGPAGTFTTLPITVDGNGNFVNNIDTTTSTEITTYVNQATNPTFAIVISTTQPTTTIVTNGPNGPTSGSIPNVLVQANVTVTGGPGTRAVTVGNAQ